MHNFPFKSILLVLLFFPSYIFSQIELEAWREHLPYSQTIAVAEGESNRIYAATPFSAFYLDQNEDQIVRMSTISGLSDVNIASMEFDAKSGFLVIAYENANIDLVKNDQVINISDIKRKSMIGSKRINRITFFNSLIYLSTDFGIVVLDPIKREIKGTYYIGPNGKNISVHDLAYDDQNFYAATSEGLYQASISEPNLSDYSNWHLETNLPKPLASYNLVTCHQGDVFVNNAGSTYGTDTVYYKQNGIWSVFNGISHQPTHRIRSFGDTLIFAQEYNFHYFYNNLSANFLAYSYGETSPSVNDVIVDKKGSFWIADKNESLVHNTREWAYFFYKPGGPTFKNVYSMSCTQGQLWVASGGIESNWGAAYAKKGIYTFQNQQWQSFNYSNTPIFDSIVDVMKVMVNPENSSEVFVASWGNGLLHFRNNQLVTIYNEQNSSLSDAVNYNGFVGVAGLAFDQQNYLWVTNSSNSNALSFRKPNGSWKALNLSPYITDNAVGDLIIDDLGQKWIIIPRGGGIVVYNDQNTPDNTTDDLKKKITDADNQGKLPVMGVNCLAKDQKGAIWVGTDEGVAVFYSPELVFSNQNYDAKQIYIEQEGISQYLLESETVSSIAIDGANRKWFGTRNAGVFLMSEDGSKQIYHFNRSNSPLLSDNIYSIAIDHQSGEVFFGTENGIISFRSTATEGSEYQETSLSVFPNPVRPEYEGLIAIKGTVENANVKITDISGNLVFETTALGGQAIWNGKNGNGEKVASGVYLVFSTDESGEQTATAKILFIK